MKKNILKMVMVVAVGFGLKSYFFENKEIIRPQAKAYSQEEMPKAPKKNLGNPYAVDMLANVHESAPSLGIEIFQEDDVEVSKDTSKNGRVNTHPFKPGSMGKFDNKRRDSLVLRNLASAQLKLKNDELRIIDEEIKHDEMKMEELIQKGDEQNVAYLEDIIAQKKARISELQ